jgi:membrane dipeptidase
LDAAGFRMIGLAHFFDNEFAGSAHGVEKYGLTEQGRALVRDMERRKILVDLAHASPKTIEDVTAMASRPVIFSHTGVRGTCDNRRNLSDEQLRKIAATGGVIGIGFWDVWMRVGCFGHALRGRPLYCPASAARPANETFMSSPGC